MQTNMGSGLELLLFYCFFCDYFRSNKNVIIQDLTPTSTHKDFS